MHPALSNQIAKTRTNELVRIAAAGSRRRPRRSLRARLGR